MASQWIRDQAVYAYGYLQGRYFALPSGPSELYGLLVSKVTSFVTLPLPLLSFLALPFFGGSATTVNLLIFYLTWSALVASHDQLTVGIGGTLLVRLLCFLLPALGFLAFDCALPDASRRIKARGRRQLPLQLGRDKLIEVTGVAIFNVLLSVALQAGLELLATRVLHLRSLLKVTAAVPLPWNLLKDVAKGVVIRGILRYVLHRYLLHTYATPLKSWHLEWQHSVRLPFSIVAAYDQPINYLLSQWLPVFLPAYLFRFHVLAWHILLAIVSLEDLFVYSGYAVLPSAIILPGMARRTESHFESIHSHKRVGNFGHLGLLDFMFGSTCEEEPDVLDDLQNEAVKHHLQQRAQDAVEGAMSGLQGAEHRQAGAKDADADATKDGHEAPGNNVGATAARGQNNTPADDDEDEGVEADENEGDEQQPPQTQRRSSRRKARKA